MKSRYFRPIQIKSEILPLLERMREFSPQRICEIGGAGGGTTLLFTHVAAPDAQLVSIDVAYTPALAAAIQSCPTARQTIRCIPFDSHEPQTRATLQRMLGGNRLDVLFIDGDHTFEGVQQDFQMYAPFVRCGGLIALHDIVPDHRARFGKGTTHHAGHVPRFWELLKRNYPGMQQEYIEDRGQDGYGIGVLEWTGDMLPIQDSDPNLFEPTRVL